MSRAVAVAVVAQLAAMVATVTNTKVRLSLLLGAVAVPALRLVAQAHPALEAQAVLRLRQARMALVVAEAVEALVAVVAVQAL